MSSPAMPLVSSAPFARDRFTWIAYFMLAYYAYLQASFGPAMPFLRDELDLSYTQGGQHISAFALGMVLAGLTADWVTRRWGRGVTFWGGGAGIAVGAVLVTLGQRPAVTIGSALVMGFIGTYLLVSIQATLADRHGERRAIALTEANIVASAATALVPLLVGVFQGLGLGWRAALYLAVLLWLLVSLSNRHIALPPMNVVRHSEGDKPRLPLVFWGYWLVIVLAAASEWSLIGWSADFLENAVGLPKVDAATLVGAFLVAMAVGRFAGSRLVHYITSGRLLLLALSVALVGFPLFWLARQPVLNVAGLFIAGLGIANLFPLTLATAAGTAPQQSDAVSARIGLGAGTAILLAPQALGSLADQSDIQTAFGVVPVLLVLALAVTLFTNWIARPAQRQADER